MTSPSHLARSLGENDLFEYLNIIELSGITEKHKKETRRALENYLNYVDWTKEIKLPPDPYYTPKKITIDDIKNTLDFLSKKRYHKQLKALALLGFTSGLRAEELYALTPKDIDLTDRIVFVKHDPKNNHTTKTGKSRVSFYTSQAKDALSEYLQEFNSDNRMKTLFPKKVLQVAFKDAPTLVKDLRKAFSQEWTRRHGDTGVKKILMGHSLRNDIDLCHYNYQSEEDLKKIYDKVMKGMVG